VAGGPGRVVPPRPGQAGGKGMKRSGPAGIQEVQVLPAYIQPGLTGQNCHQSGKSGPQAHCIRNHSQRCRNLQSAYHSNDRRGGWKKPVHRRFCHPYTGKSASPPYNGSRCVIQRLPYPTTERERQEARLPFFLSTPCCKNKIRIRTGLLMQS